MDRRGSVSSVPTCYPDRPASVEIVQTHISIVSIAGGLIYKFKKPVRLPFLDFSTIELRRHYCREEVRLNRRLCPDVYLGTTALARTAPARSPISRRWGSRGCSSELHLAVGGAG